MSKPHNWQDQLEIERELLRKSRTEWLNSLSDQGHSWPDLSRKFGIDRTVLGRIVEQCGVEIKFLPGRARKASKATRPKCEPSKPDLPDVLAAFIASAKASNNKLREFTR